MGIISVHPLSLYMISWQCFLHCTREKRKKEEKSTYFRLILFIFTSDLLFLFTKEREKYSKEHFNSSHFYLNDFFGSVSYNAQTVLWKNPSTLYGIVLLHPSQIYCFSLLSIQKYLKITRQENKSYLC